MAHNWETITDSISHDFLVKGTELAQMVCRDRNSRFAIVEVRTLESDGFPGVKYRVRDAERISDAEVKEGKRPPSVGVFSTFEDAMGYIQATLD